MNKVDSDQYLYTYYMMYLCLFGMALKKNWYRPAQVFYGCLKANQQAVKNGLKMLGKDKSQTDSFVVVQDFELDHAKLGYLKHLLNQSGFSLFIDFDEERAEILKGLKDYQPVTDLPCEVKNFEQAEAIAQTIIKIHDKLNDRFKKYKKCVDYVQSIHFGEKLGIYDFFEPNTKLLVRAEVFYRLAQYTSDIQMSHKVLEKSIDFRREYRNSIQFGDIKTGFCNDAFILETMLHMLKLRVKNLLLDSKLIELKDQCVFAGKLFVVTVDLHHSKIDPDLLEKSFKIVLELHKCHKLYYKDNRDPDLLRSCSRLIAKIAKKSSELGWWMESRCKLKCDWKKMSEQKLVQLIENLEFKQE